MLNRLPIIAQLTLITCLALPSVGCQADQMVDAQQKYEQSLKQKLLIRMDLETMFRDEKLRDLAYAAGKGRVSSIDKLLKSGLDVNAKGTRNATALFWAMRKDNEKGFNHLLKAGANPNVKFGDGGTVMHWLARKQDCAMLKTALAHGGNPNLKASLFNAPVAFETLKPGKNKGVPECLKVLLANGADIELTDDKGYTMLLWVADLARFDIALYLLDKGAATTAINKQNKDLSTIIASFDNAFKKGSVTEQNWHKFKQKLAEKSKS